MDLRAEASSSGSVIVISCSIEAASSSTGTTSDCATITFPGSVAVSFPVSMSVSGGMPISGVVSFFPISSLSIASMFSSLVHSVSILVSGISSPSFWMSFSSIGVAAISLSSTTPSPLSTSPLVSTSQGWIGASILSLSSISGTPSSESPPPSPLSPPSSCCG